MLVWGKNSRTGQNGNLLINDTGSGMWCFVSFRRHAGDLLISSETIIKVHNVSKCYQIYDQPNDRLKQGLFSLAARLCPITTLKQSLVQKAYACSRQYWALHDRQF